MLKSSKLTLAALIVGILAAITFAIGWFGYVSGHCGVVRFYEQLYGIFVLFVWFILTCIGLWMLRFKAGKNPRLRIMGIIMVLLACVGIIITGSLSYLDFQRMNRQAASPVIEF